MKLCLSCRRFSRHAAKFCANCCRSFGGRLCKDSHLSPRSARCCVECGSNELTKGTAYLSFRLPHLLLTMVAFIFLAKVVVVALPTVALLFSDAFSSTLHFVFGVSLLDVIFGILRLVVVLILVEIAIRMMLPKKLPSNLLTVKLAKLALVWTARLLGRLCVGLLGIEEPERAKQKKSKSQQKRFSRN